MLAKRIQYGQDGPRVASILNETVCRDPVCLFAYCYWTYWLFLPIQDGICNYAFQFKPGKRPSERDSEKQPFGCWYFWSEPGKTSRSLVQTGRSIWNARYYPSIYIILTNRSVSQIGNFPCFQLVMYCS